ncbi:MAG: hypothetical protein RL563_232 [Pseudomonadota bacterium]
MLTLHSPAKSTILIVDDQPENIHLLAHALDDHYNIQFALSGLAAIEVLNKHRPDLILLDVIMPEMDGYEFCKQLKNRPDTADIPIIFITARQDEASESLALMTGGVDFIHKPVNPDVLLARVHTHIQLKKQLDLLRQLSTIDPLTGLANRRQFFERFNAEWTRMMRNESMVTVMMIDVDYFKAYNDHYGHVAGDDCLSRVGQTVAATLSRAGDLVGRYGGEEFIVYMADTGLEQAVLAAEKVRQHVEALAIPNQGVAETKTNVVTVSIGVAAAYPRYKQNSLQSESLPNDREQIQKAEINALIEAADQALYQSKSLGRNRVTASFVFHSNVAT